MKRSALISMLVLLLLSTALYLPMLRADFVWDARAQILTDSYLHTPGHWADILSLRVLGQDVLDNNRPLQLLSLLADASLWGENPFGFHLTNLLLHSACVLLIFFFCRKVSASAGAAFCAALVFAVHPVNCEAVAEVSYREDLLSLLCIGAALNFAAAFAPVWNLRNLAAATACIAFLLFAVCAKENAVAGPFILAAYWFVFRRGESSRGRLLLLGGAFLLPAAFLTARFLLQPKHSKIFVEHPAYLGGSFFDALITVPRIWASYICKIFVPLNLCADYGPYSLQNISLALALSIVLATFLVQFWISRKQPLFAFGSVIFWLSLIPVSNFIPIYRPMADRFLYLPMSGFAVMVCSLLRQPCPKRRFCIWLIAFWIIGLAVFTFQQQKIWRNSLSLWSDTLEKNPLSWTAAINLGTALVDTNRHEEAVGIFQRAVNMRDCAESHAGLALALDAAGRQTEAEASLRKAISMDDRYRHPQKLVEALTWEPHLAQRLQAILKRNPDL